jgi:NAD(P)-dependent dehydrogenase (short-subunit alcohol dehydrogenase family)
MSAPVWFVTGASRGFGREIVLAALEKGHRVVATARDPRTVAAWLPETHRANSLLLPLNVTDPRQRETALAATLSAFGSIDILVNNAGYGYLTAVEEGEEREIRALFEANFFAVAALTREVLPAMRARRSGRIVNISSVGGFVGFPGSGYYAASKFALEGLSESLRAEVAPLGIDILLVEPGPFRTDWAGSSMRQSPTFLADYEATSGQRRRQVAEASGTQAGCPRRAAKIIVEAALSPAPPFRLPLGEIAIRTIRAALREVEEDIAPWAERGLWSDVPIAAEAV